VRERDRSDKPAYVLKWKARIDDGRRVRRGQFRTLMSVDDLVDELFQALADAGELEDTIAFYLSDNGFQWTEHRMLGKWSPYRHAVSIPLLMRRPGGEGAGTVDERLVANIDIAPTILDTAGIPQAGEPMDGRSLLDDTARRRILLEAWGYPTDQRWASLRTDRYTYVEYYPLEEPGVLFREYYAADDRWELRNLFGDGKPSNDPRKQVLHQRLKAARTCAGTDGPGACP
jgi:arylsulfatase A-like enzyme